MTQKQLLVNNPSPRYEIIRKDLEKLEEMSQSLKIRVNSLLSIIVGSQPDDGLNIKENMESRDHESLYEFISNVINNIRKDLNSINEQLDRL